jgi:hypothetical protein
MKQSWVQTLMACQVDGPTLTAAAAATCLPQQAKFIIPNNFIERIGDGIHIWASGRVSTVITTPGTIRIDVRFGAALVFDTLAILPDTVAGHTTVGWVLDVKLTARAIGATANMMGQGLFTCEDILGVPATAPKGVLSAMVPWNAAPAVGANFDSTASNAFDMFFTQTAATGSFTLHQLFVTSLN